MATGEIEIKFEVEWRECEPNGQRCVICDDVIYGRTWQMWVAFNGEPFQPETMCMCAACYGLKSGHDK